jgi:hypothetical protein
LNPAREDFAGFFFCDPVIRLTAEQAKEKQLLTWMDRIYRMKRADVEA